MGLSPPAAGNRLKPLGDPAQDTGRDLTMPWDDDLGDAI
jgi:hypothetical protein